MGKFEILSKELERQAEEGLILYVWLAVTSRSLEIKELHTRIR